MRVLAIEPDEHGRRHDEMQRCVDIAGKHRKNCDVADAGIEAVLDVDVQP
jgi:hypothetical protein